MWIRKPFSQLFCLGMERLASTRVWRKRGKIALSLLSGIWERFYVVVASLDNGSYIVLVALVSSLVVNECVCCYSSASRLGKELMVVDMALYVYGYLELKVW